jgi:hypothetical protein
MRTFFDGELDRDNPHVPAGVRLFEQRQQVDAVARNDNLARRRALANVRGDQVEVISACDRAELDRPLPRTRTR